MQGLQQMQTSAWVVQIEAVVNFFKKYKKYF